MALLVALVAGLLVVAVSQAIDKMDHSHPKGFLTRYLRVGPFGSDASRIPFYHYDKFIAPNLNRMKHAHGPDALSHQNRLAENIPAADGTQDRDVVSGHGGAAVLNLGDRSFITLNDKAIHPTAPLQKSMDFRATREDALTGTKDRGFPNMYW